MFTQLINFDAFYQLRQKAFPLFALLFTFFGYFIGANASAPANVNFNAGYQVNSFVGLFSLGSVFIIMFFAISGVIRDEQYKMDSILYGTPIKKVNFFWSRFIGIFLFSLLAFTPFLLGVMLGYTIAPLDQERLAPFNIMTFINPWLIIVVPNIFICTTLIFSVSILSKSNVATYVSAIFIYMLYMLCSIFLNSPLMAQSVPSSPEAMAIAALADPFGISAFFEQTQFWTAFDKNTKLLSLSGLYLWNRIIWVSVSVVVLLMTYHSFSFRKNNQKAKKEKAPKAPLPQPSIKQYRTIVPTAKANFPAFISLLKMELNNITKSIPFVAIMLIWVVLSISEISSRVFSGGEYNNSLYPLTNLLIENILDPLKMLGFILIVFYSGELVWREQSLKFSGIIDATPTKNWAFFTSKLMALLLLPALLIGVGAIISIGFQVGSGFFHTETGQYLSMFYYNGLQLFLFCVLAIFVQSIVANKYLGMGITGILIIGCFLSPKIGIEYPLLRFAYLPNISYNNMTGYSANALYFHHLALYWLGMAGTFTLISFKLWQRGVYSSTTSQFKALISNWVNWERVALAGSFIVLMTGAGLVFYNMNIADEYYSSTDKMDYREAYERQFKQYESLPRLYRQAIKTTVDLYPEEDSYSLKADYVMVNRDSTPITEVFISAKVPLKSIALENAELIKSSTEFDTYLFKFKNPVLPNQTVKMTYLIDYQAKGYGYSQEILANGTYLSHRSFEPSMSYKSGLEISDNFERSKRGLPKKEQEVTTDEHLSLDDFKVGRVSYETVISTTASETAIGSGSLIRQWEENGRNYYHYKSTQKVIPTMAYFSSSYEMKKEQYKGVDIEQYYYPAHHFNIDSVSSSIKTTLDYCSNNFGDYPFEHIRVAEVPAHWPFGGFAHPGVISMVEDRLYLADIRDGAQFNIVAKRTIHEVAHQWWGHTLVPKVVGGGSLLVEGFAKYTEATVMEKIYGKRAVYQLSETANRRYFTGRAFASEAESPISLVNGQGYINYGKSYIIMLALRDLLGEEKVNKAMKNLADRYRNDTMFSATSLEFLDVLYKVSSKSQRSLIDDWFKRIITYDLAIQNIEQKPLANGQFEINITVKAKRFETLASGKQTEIKIDEPIQIGLFDRHPSLIDNQTKAIYLKHHAISKDQQVVKVIVEKLPSHIAIDPYGTRVDENLVDNIKNL